MTFAEFMDKAEQAFPGSEVGEDNDGQLVIYTNLAVDGENVVTFENPAPFPHEIGGLAQ